MKRSPSSSDERGERKRVVKKVRSIKGIKGSDEPAADLPARSPQERIVDGRASDLPGDALGRVWIERVTPETRKLSIRLSPSASAANIAARCESDLSPGGAISPCRLGPGEMIRFIGKGGSSKRFLILL